MPTPTPIAVGEVQVLAAALGVQRDHVTLEALPSISATHHEKLVTLAASLAADFAAESLVFTGASHASNSPLLGTLNLQMALPPAANFIGRDIAKALPRSSDARVLRQFVNAAQMTLHQSPALSTVAEGAVNSLWCSQALPADALSRTWLQGGLIAWWDALPAWDAALDLSVLKGSSTLCKLHIIFSDVTLQVMLKRRPSWAFWRQPMALMDVLNRV
jgi:hypothetical protein